MNASAKGITIKVIAYQFIFLLVHYLYDWFPSSFTYLLGTTDESVFQHMKAGFYSLLFLALFEYLVARKNIPSISNFFFARTFSSLLIPLFIFVYYMTGPAYFVEFHSIPVEIIYANLALIATSLSTFVIEGHIEKIEQSRGLRIVFIILFALFLSEFVIFNYRLPWFDIFANPPGW
jgi:hypothetical protein